MPRVKVQYRSASKDVYKKFKQKYPQYKIDFNTWATIIYTFNYAFRDYILETGEKTKYMYGFGDFSITKWKPEKTIIYEGEEKVALPVDWKKTKENGGKKVFHMNFGTEGYKFKWKWFTTSGRFFMYSLWNFKPSRVSSRLLKHYLSLPDYHYKYLEWH